MIEKLGDEGKELKQKFRENEFKKIMLERKKELSIDEQKVLDSLQQTRDELVKKMKQNFYLSNFKPRNN